MDLAENRRARFEYEFEDTLEAGIELLGQEVKSVKNGRFELVGSYVVLRHGEAWLLNATIPAHQPKNAPKDFAPDRSRRLLLHKEQLETLAGKLSEKGKVLVPLKAYVKNGRVKIALGLGRARKAHDKREAIKKREARKEMRGA